MYHRPESQLQLFEDFFLPFGRKLNKDNRWVQLASMIPWWRAEEKYAKAFRKSMRGHKHAFPQASRCRCHPSNQRMDVRRGSGTSEATRQDDSQDPPSGIVLMMSHPSIRMTKVKRTRAIKVTCCSTRPVHRRISRIRPI